MVNGPHNKDGHPFCNELLNIYHNLSNAIDGTTLWRAVWCHMVVVKMQLWAGSDFLLTVTSCSKQNRKLQFMSPQPGNNLQDGCSWLKTYHQMQELRAVVAFSCCICHRLKFKLLSICGAKHKPNACHKNTSTCHFEDSENPQFVGTHEHEKLCSCVNEYNHLYSFMSTERKGNKGSEAEVQPLL